MKLRVQFTIRRLMLLVLCAACAIASFRYYFLVDVTNRYEAVEVVGKSRFDRIAAHADLVAGLDERFDRTSEPSWFANAMAGGKPRWTPARSDWFVVNENETVCFVHIVSANNAMAIDIWTCRQMLQYKLDDAKPIPPNDVQAAKLGTELYNQWWDWCFENKPMRKVK